MLSGLVRRHRPHRAGFASWMFVLRERQRGDEQQDARAAPSKSPTTLPGSVCVLHHG
jgi:hypothetical protein